MPAPASFPLVRGRTMRVTKLDGCGNVVLAADSQVVTDGFVSIAATANINEGDEIRVVNANGRTCILDTPCPETTGYTLEITFCDVNPCLFSIVTGQPQVLDVNGDVSGFRMNTQISACDSGFALEIWTGVPGEACGGASGAFGYLLIPFVRSGVIGDFTVENAALSFVLSNAVTKDGNAWGVGPYHVVEDVAGDPDFLPDAIDPNDAIYVTYTTIPPPGPTDGCIPVTAVQATGATAGTPGTFTPTNAMKPGSFDLLVAEGVVATPTTAWTTGQYVQTAEAGTAGRAYWNGTTWINGTA